MRKCVYDKKNVIFLCDVFCYQPTMTLFLQRDADK